MVDAGDLKSPAPWGVRVRVSPSVPYAGVVKLVDTLDLGSSGFGCGGSTPSARTI